MFFNKIDENLLNVVRSADKNEDINCLVYANNFYVAKKYIQNSFNCEINEYPFICALGIKTNIKNIKNLASKSHVKYVSSVAKVFMQMENTRKVMHIDEVKNSFSGNGVTVAVIDTGIAENLDFCSFENRIIGFKDFINNRETPYDDNGHGTFVSGVLCGNGFMSGRKYMGVAPKCKIVMCKALDNNGETGALTILEAMQWIYDNRKKYNIKVVCMSFGSQPLKSGDPLMLGAEALWNEGIVVVAAAGNSGPDKITIKSPGISGKIITVGALDDGRKLGDVNIKNFKVADFSSRGPAYNFYKPDCLACGVDITGCTNRVDEIYSKMSGTSVATPIVAGSCALLLEKEPRISPLQVKSRIIRSCNKIQGSRNDEGYGILDVEKLLLE